MPKVTQILAMRNHRLTKSQRNPASKFALGCSGFISLLAALSAIVLAFMYARVTIDLPSVEVLPHLIEGDKSPVNNPTRFYDRSGKHILLTLENPYIPDWQYLRYENDTKAEQKSDETQNSLPEDLVTATIASFDPYFWEHPGFNFRPNYISELTLAQHLISEFLLAEENPSLIRSLRERLLAAQITSRFGREKILEWYLNSANYGNLAFGADAAARLYFDKPAPELNLAEAALLAGTAQSPALNPLDAPQAALENQKLVIQDMLDQRLITPGEGVLAAQEEIVLASSINTRWNYEGGEIAPAFLLLAIEQLEDHIPRSRLERGGYKVYTTLDYDLQVQAACSAKAQLERLNPGTSQTIAQSCEANRLLPALPEETNILLGNLNAEFLLLEPHKGQILALFGVSSEGIQTASFNDHPLGSLATPFIYLTAFTREMSPASLVWDIPPEEGSASIRNFDDAYNGPQRLRNAFANDYLVPAQNVMEQVGLENVWRTARQFGIIFPDPAAITQESNLQIFGDNNLLEITQAYSVFSNQGIMSGHVFSNHQDDNALTNWRDAQLALLEPTAVFDVEDIDGNVLFEWNEPQTRPIISPQLSYLMTHVMSDEAARWPSLGHPNALEIGRPAAAKMGRNESGDSNWTIGYTPQLALGVWIGSGNNESIQLESNQAYLLQQATAGLWHSIIQYASKDLTYQTFPIPSGISNIQVCDPSGLLPTRECPNIVDEVFLAGSEPLQKDNLYVNIQINRNTNRRATAFTSPDIVEDRTYMILPNEAEDWALLAGIETPPQSYDTIPLEIPFWPDSQITSPGIFETIKGKVSIIGNADGKEFDFYRVQVGTGFNPQYWYQIGEDGNRPISNGTLATWDTSGLDGLYAIQLLVVSQDRSVQRSTSLVTIDNTPPVTRITNPSPGETILKSELPVIVLQADVQDELGIEEVKFFIDDKLLKELTQPPYAISWNAHPGTYKLRVQAIDRAGNESQDSNEFQVK
jgi:membrane peptidoglycan carboxypeptidase